MATVVQSAERATGTRLLFIDNIRWTMIVLVICHHAAVTYSHVGGWFYFDGPKPTIVTTALLATFETFNQAFFMGLLFLIAGYFAPAAFDKKGAASFVRDRFVRLGVPSLFFMLVIYPVTVYWLLREFNDPSIPPLSAAYGRFLTSGKVWSASGPMWFAVALLIFCICYAGVRMVTHMDIRGAAAPMPGHKAVLALIAVMGSCSFLVRITQPVGTSALDFVNMQTCYFSQYILLFLVGICAYRGDWLARIPYAFGMFWFRLARLIGIPGWFVLLGVSGALQGHSASLLGGFHWQSAAFCYWEAFFCLGMCLGLIVVFRDKFSGQGRFAQWMSRNSFSAYLFHTPLLVAVTLALKPMVAPPLVKFIIAALLAVPITFAVSGLLRERVPGLRRLL